MAKEKRATSKPHPDTTALRGLWVCFCTLAIFLSLVSFAFGDYSSNWLGWIGYGIGRALHALLGIGSYIACAGLGWIGWRLLFNKPIHHPYLKVFFAAALIISVNFLLSLLEERSQIGKMLGHLLYPTLWQKKLYYHLGGAPFYYLYHDIPKINLLHTLGTTGIFLLFSTTLTVSILYLTKITPTQILQAIIAFYKLLYKTVDHKVEIAAEPKPKNDSSRLVSLRIPGTKNVSHKDAPALHTDEMLAIQPETELTQRPSISQKLQNDREKSAKKEKSTVRQEAITAQKVYNGDFTHYKIPPASLLTNAKKVDQTALKQNLKRQAEVLEETLFSFGIEAKVGQINCGPSITSFEVHPAIGVKVQKIRTLENDIALNMEAKSIRIIAPIPGKAAVGIEVPNPQPQEVGFKEMLIAYQQGTRKCHIPILLGKAVNGDYVMSDLAKMPHCIIAGATGSGKSVCINTIIMAILMNAKPDEIKFIMVDPKKVELTPYGRLPHMLAPVITEPQGACAALNWLVKEMERRYDILKQLGVRNIESFNNRTVNKELEESLDQEIPAHLPYIVVIIDELADLMMVASNDIETPIARIAQMARAIGIHLILATQRPSREVITGLIKANFPTRISFKVASRINSQIVLDETGAESLLGNGDMLFLPPGTSVLVRAQGAFIRDEDIAATIKQICDQAPPNYAIASFDDLGREQAAVANEDASADTLFEQAKTIVLNTGNASTTFLQRKLKIGYARAASLMDELESKKVVSTADGNKVRKILGSHSQSSLPEENEE